MSSKKTIMCEMINNQLKNVRPDKKLSYNDIKRIVKNIDSTIFGEECCMWNGYIANLQDNKSAYINFYFREKKLALHRLLYYNYVGPIDHNEHIAFSCNNRGKCCTLRHLIKNERDYTENEDEDEVEVQEEKEDENLNEEIYDEKNEHNLNNKKIINIDKFTISFD